MSKRPRLHLVEGGLSQEQHKIYRLRAASTIEAPAAEPWPKDGEWRTLIRRLMRKPQEGA
jgi:hypothetical protein